MSHVSRLSPSLTRIPQLCLDPSDPCPGLILSPETCMGGGDCWCMLAWLCQPTDQLTMTGSCLSVSIMLIQVPRSYLSPPLSGCFLGTLESANLHPEVLEVGQALTHLLLSFLLFLILFHFVCSSVWLSSISMTSPSFQRVHKSLGGFRAERHG